MAIDADADLTWDVYIECDAEGCKEIEFEYGVNPDCTDDDAGKSSAQEQAKREFIKQGWIIIERDYEKKTPEKHYCPEHAHLAT